MSPSMTPRERMLATFAGQPVDHFPVTAPYLMLLQADHWTEIMQQPSYTYYQWCLQPVEEHLRAYARMNDLLPFDIAQPDQWASDRAARAHQQIVPGENGEWFRVDDRDGSRKKLVLNLHEKDEESEWPRVIDTASDIEKKIEVRPFQENLENGRLEYGQAYQKKWGHERFIAGTIVNSFYMSSHYVGLKNRFVLVKDEPELMHAIIDRLTLQNIETVRAMAAVGCDAVFIDDATATKDMISRKMYCEFSLPYMQRTIAEIHNLGMKATVIYFGGIADRVEEIVQTGADALLMETSMKGFTNDLEEIGAQVNNRMLLFGNLDPLQDIELSSDAALEAVMAKQIAVGKKYGRFVVSTGSPITPHTSLARIQKYIQLGQELSKG
jgi:uroporphyrinogen-III decarboxylase